MDSETHKYPSNSKPWPKYSTQYEGMLAILLFVPGHSPWKGPMSWTGASTLEFRAITSPLRTAKTFPVCIHYDQ